MEVSVSVIIPCYRQARFLSQAIDSCLSQTFKNVEIIVVNDGSDDNTEDVVSRYTGRIKYFSKDNGGPSSARNVGIRASSGNYLLFLDGDDILHPDAVESCVHSVSPQGDYAVLMGYRDFSDNPAERCQHRKLGEPISPPAENAPFPAIFITNLMPIHCWLVPKRLVVECEGFDETLPSHEDWDFWMRLCLAGMKLRTVPLVGAYYRRSAGSLSTNRQVMNDTARRVFLRTANIVLSDPQLIQKVGPALLFATRFKLRVAIARRESNEWIRSLLRISAALGVRGCSLSGRWTRHVIDVVFGDYAEFAIMTYFKVFERRTFRQYSGSSGKAT